jgi:3-hydroxyacyl-[acyl-carrier-protein] dehydratase
VDYNPEIYQSIPHRPPFLWVDKIISLAPESIETEKFISPDLDVFKGHYPDYPIMPGVLLCEAVFQSGALLMADNLKRMESPPSQTGLMPVLTRIKSAKFKREVKPGDTIRIQVKVDESVGNVWFFKGKVTVDDKTALKVDFGCALVDSPQQENIR